MSKVQCAIQQSVIAELTLLRGSQIAFIEQPPHHYEDAIYWVTSSVADIRTGITHVHEWVNYLEHDLIKEEHLTIPELANEMRKVLESTDCYAIDAEEHLVTGSALKPDINWSSETIDALRSLISGIDCTTAAGQAEIRGAIKVLETLGLPAGTASEHERVA